MSTQAIAETVTDADVAGKLALPPDMSKRDRRTAWLVTEIRLTEGTIKQPIRLPDPDEKSSWVKIEPTYVMAVLAYDARRIASRELGVAPERIRLQQTGKTLKGLYESGPVSRDARFFE